MRISDWSSDVCSSDLERYAARVELRPGSFDGAGYAGVDGDRLAAQRETSEVERRQVEDVVDQVEELLSATAYVGGVFAGDRTIVVQGKTVSVRVDLGGGRCLKKTPRKKRADRT